MNTPSNQEKEIIEKVIEIESQSERDEFIKRVCSENQALFRHVPIPDESKMTVEAGAMIGRYKLLEKIGEGGFGVVWAAEQKEPVRRRVALKIIKLGMDPSRWWPASKPNVRPSP